MAQIEDVVAQLRLETARFNAALKDAEGQMGRSTTAMSGIVDGLSRRFTALGTAISAAFVPITAAAAAGVGLLALTKSVTQVGDELNRLSIQTGATVEDLSALRVAAQLNDTNISDVARSIRFLNQSLIEATQQAGDARDAYAALGISTADLAQLSGQPVKMLELVAKRLDEVTNSSNKNVIALRLMGRSASEMSAFMQDLADRGMVGLREESDRLFATWSQESARAADDFNDAMDRIRVSAGGLAKDLVVTLLPVFQRIFLAIRQVMGTTTGLDKTLGRTVEIAGELEKLNRQRGLLLSQQDKLPALLQEENLRKIKDTEAAMQALNQEAQALSKSIALATEPPGTVGFGLEPPITPPPRPTRTGALPDKDAAAKAAKAATDAERDARRELEEFVRESNARMEADDKDRADALTAAMESAEAPIDTFRRQLEELQRLQPFLPVETFSKAVGALSQEFSRADPATRQWLDNLERAGAILQANETPLDTYNRALAELTRLHEAGALSAAQFERVLGNLDAGLYEQLQALNETNDAVRDFGLVFTSAFEDAAVAGADFNEVLGGLVEDLHRLALRLIVTEPLLKALEQAFKDLKATDITTFFAKVASWLGTLIPGAAAPASGTPAVKTPPAPNVPSVPDPTITMPDVHTSRSAADAVTVNVINNANNTTVSQQQTTGPNGSVQLDVVIDEMMAGQAASPNNAYARTMRGTYGLQPQLIGR